MTLGFNTSELMKVIVVGKGGREHALVTALVESNSGPEVYSHPGSDAIFDIAKRLPTEVSDVDSLVAAMVSEKIDLCVGGEESWLVKGLADKAREVGIPTWGPVAQSAQLESSKQFAKEFMVRHGIPTGGYAVAGSAVEAKAAIAGYPTVLKFDGLAAGKGVVICNNDLETRSSCRQNRLRSSDSTVDRDNKITPLICELLKTCGVKPIPILKSMGHKCTHICIWPECLHHVVQNGCGCNAINVIITINDDAPATIQSLDDPF